MRLPKFLFAVPLVLALGLSAAGAGAGAEPQPPEAHGPAVFMPGNLVVARTQFTTVPGMHAGVTQLPPGCAGNNCVTANAGGDYPYVFDNASVDGSFGVTSKIFLDQMSPFGHVVSSLEVPNSSEPGVTAATNQAVTSFSSKSELALNLSTDGRTLTFVGYDAPVDGVDVSNANTPGAADPTNPIPASYYRVVTDVNARGQFTYTLTNAFTGDNGRAAILNAEDGVLYAAGNASGSLKPSENPNAGGVILGAGAQIMTPQDTPEAQQNPGTPTPVGSFAVTEVGAPKIDKVGKDTNFRGITIFNNVLYYTKGSGGKGINSVYFVDTASTGCTTNGGTGLPAAGATLPTSPITPSDPAQLLSLGVQPYNMCVLKGFPTVLNSSNSAPLYPFGLWFANSTTLYIADEGSGDNTYAGGTYTSAAAQTTAGLQKWVLSGGAWHLAYTLTNGLDLGKPYTVPGYPTGINSVSGLPWAPATDGLRQLTGRVLPDGTAVIYATTSTVSGSGDQGADPNKVVAIVDPLRASTAPAWERFVTLRTAQTGDLFRGIAWTPTGDGHEAPIPHLPPFFSHP